MRIIDKNTDFYDYLQYAFPDDSITFDRRNSFLLTKEMIKKNFHPEKPKKYYTPNNNRFILLQVCNTFWLFYVTVEDLSDINWYPYVEVNKYSISLIDTWKNYNKQRKLIELSLIKFLNPVGYRYNKKIYKYVFYEDEFKKDILQYINSGDYEIDYNLGQQTVRSGGWPNEKTTIKDIPLLSASGLAEFIDPLEMYRSIEEYFSLEKQSAERDSSIGITDKEKVINHGFDVKKSFRGKVKKDGGN